MLPEDAAFETFMDRAYESFRESALEDWQLYDRIVNDFKEARLKDYYLDHPGVIEPAKAMLDEARHLLAPHTRASFVLAVASGEVGLNIGIFIPILHGCFHTDSAADLLVRIIVTTKDQKLTNALRKVFKHFTEIDLETIHRSGSADNLWKEIQGFHKIRNRVLHSAETVGHKEASTAIKVTETILNDVFKAILKKLGLHLHAETHVCGSSGCPSSN
jgi:hypothetical protein